MDKGCKVKKFRWTIIRPRIRVVGKERRWIKGAKSKYELGDENNKAGLEEKDKTSVVEFFNYTARPTI